MKEPGGVTEVARATGYSPSTVHGHLSTLVERGYAYKEGDVYQVGPEFMRLGHYARTRKCAYVLAERYTEWLFEETGYRSVFVAEQGGRGVFLHTTSGEGSEWRHETVGNRLYLHDTAVGKAMLAEMSEWRVESILDEWGLVAETAKTIDDRERLDTELEAVRRLGYATNFGENIEGLAAVGAAVTDRSGYVVGAVSVSGPVRQFTDDDLQETLGAALLHTVEEYELELSLS